MTEPKKPHERKRPPRKGEGRPPFKPTEPQRKTVESMAGYGIPHLEIARVVGCDKKTLEKHFREELDTGHVKANAKVAESLYQKAIGNGSQAVTAAIWWTKARMGWKEHKVEEHTVSSQMEELMRIVYDRSRIARENRRSLERPPLEIEQSVSDN